MSDVGTLKKIGGSDPKNLTHGDYTWMDGDMAFGWPGADLDLTTNGTAIGCSYNYRNGSLFHAGETTSGSYAGYSCDVLTSTRGALACSNLSLGSEDFPFAKKYVEMENAAPERKSVKQLGAYSVVADRFDKPNTRLDKTPMELVGKGYWGHQTGYNVLFGDGAVRWFGDPQQRFMWREAPTRDLLNAIGTGNAGYLYKAHKGTGCTTWVGGSQAVSYGVGIFHEFDRMIDSEIIHSVTYLGPAPTD